MYLLCAGTGVPVPTPAVLPRETPPMGQRIAILNHKGGVGKTAVTLGLASAAWAADHPVLVVDLDPQGSATWALGVDPDDVSTTAADVLGRASAATAIVPAGWGGTVSVLPGSPDLQQRERGRADRLREALDRLGDDVLDPATIVLIDCPPSLGNLTANGLAAVQHAIVVVEPAALSLRGIGGVADLIDEVWDEHNRDLELSGVIVNKVPTSSAEADRRGDELTRIVGRRAVWQPAIPQRVVVNEAIGARLPIHALGARGGEVAEVFDRLWRRVRRLRTH